MRILVLVSSLTGLSVALASCGSGDEASASGGAAGQAGTGASGGGAGTSGAGASGARGSSSGLGGASGASMQGEAGDAAAGAPIDHPDPPTDYTPMPGTCGFDAPAFCETFEAGPKDGGRSGELDPARWSVARAMPYNPASFDDAFRVGPALIGACRDGLSNTRVLPDSDVLVCDPVPTIPTRHALAVAAEQNYGLATYRIRQPFDFTGRTGTIELDLDLTNNGLGGWPALIIAEDPSPTPSFDWQERGSGPKNGVEIEFGTGWCNTPQTVETIVYAFRDYVQTQYVPSFDCDIPHVTSAPGSLNHVIVYVTQAGLEVWASDPSPDGLTFPNLTLLWSRALELPFSRGFVSLALRNHATMKYWLGSAASVRFDNVGFDGPKVGGHREYSAPDSLTSFTGLPGCAPGGGECRWEGDVIAELPDESGRTSCADTTCTYPGEGRNVGYVVPRSDETEPPAALDFSGVDLNGAKSARLTLAAVYPAFDWNGVSHPPTFITLRYRVNGGAWHDRNVTDAEANAFIDYNPDLGGAGGGSGLLNQVIELDLAELVAGDNRIELVSDNTWTGDYRVAVTAADLVIDE